MKLTAGKVASRSALAALISLGVFANAQAQDANPNAFVEKIANQALSALLQDNAARNGDLRAINRLVDQYIVPHVNMEKTTRLATGQPWRQATDQQKAALVEGFKNTLVRTYSGALKDVTDNTKINVAQFRGDPNAADVVVRTTLTGVSNTPVAVDYRLEKAGSSWKVYDMNIEGIWLIQNYRNQFAGEISRNGIDGLIKSLQRQ
ncbi:Intermembrane phospholipid transport system binding protein MlaC [Oligella sp. MSHR50489EDL]|uniref:MlaC/ttg2D family ABC transporter substrate-binding protein n=1 Tax=Oligella sp. MSHR50489EDL TaxID=3139409 RepID=UPI003D8177CD